VQPLYTDELKAPVRDAPGDAVFAHMVAAIRDAPGRCVEVLPGPSKSDGFPQLFDLWLLGGTRSVPLGEAFLNSSTSRLLATSPLVASAVARNEYLLLPRGARKVHAPIDPYARMMAVHIRRWLQAMSSSARADAAF
jgi:hypothetical protein